MELKRVWGNVLCVEDEQVYIYKGCEALSKSSQVASKFFNCFVLTSLSTDSTRFFSNSSVWEKTRGVCGQAMY